MFIGGANQDPSDGIRPPSFKGALRFWWRALNWVKFYNDSLNEKEALQALHQEESRLFGSAVTDGKGGQGIFLLSIQHGTLAKEAKGKIHNKFKKYPAARYLSYGLMGAFGANTAKLERGCIQDQQNFTVLLKFRKDAEEDILSALKVMGLIGGLGSRARKGLGSVALQSLKVSDDGKTWKDIWNAPTTIAEYKNELLFLLQDAVDQAGDIPPFSAISSESDVSVLVLSSDSLKVMNTYGEAMMMYRSWGKNGKVLNKAREENFKDDHDWSKGLMSDEFHPQRIVFGLPHNYGKHENLHVEPAKHKRRASPLFFHVHPIGDQFVGVSVLMPAQFLPKNEKIKAGLKFVDSKIEWYVLTDFIRGINKQGQARFPKAQNIIRGAM